LNKINKLFKADLKVINMGLESFQKDLKSQDVDAIQMNWRPAAGGNSKMIALLNRLKG
jgi:hypothetical protein